MARDDNNAPFPSRPCVPVAGGFGIGAFEAREIVRSMGGRLEVDSREGLGTRFIISFPLAAVAEFLEPSSNTQTTEAG